MLETILIAVLTGLFTIMASSLVSVMLAPKVLKRMIKEAVMNHVAVYHKEMISEAISTHTKSCVANGTISQIRDAVFWLVIKSGGNPKELGLTRE
jgi:hypothetical protein